MQHVAMEQQNWKAVAEALRASRIAQGLPQTELAAKADVSRVTVQSLEGGRDRMRIGPGLLAVVRALGWPEGHIERLLAGKVEGPPSKRPPTPGEASSDLPLAVAHELKQGSLIDSRVLQLGEDSDARMIVVLRGEPDMTPEQIERALKEWKRVVTQMRMGETHGG